MKRTTKTSQEKEAIIAEYLLGEVSYRSLGKKYGIDFRLIHSWVRKFQGIPLKKSQTKSTPSQAQQSLPADVKALQEELRKAKLHNELLNAMIDIAEKQLNIDIRKKSGTRR